MPLIKDFDQSTFSEKLKRILLDRKKTVTVFADELGISRQGLYYRFENNSWTVNDLYKIAEVLHVDPKELI